MATHSSILAWEIPWTEEPGGLYLVGSTKQVNRAATESKILSASFPPSTGHSVCPFTASASLFLPPLPLQGPPKEPCSAPVASHQGVNAQLCVTLGGPMACNPPGSSVHRNFPARMLEPVAVSSSRGSS